MLPDLSAVIYDCHLYYLNCVSVKKRTHKSLKCSLTKFFVISAIANHNAILFNFCILATKLIFSLF